MGVHCFVTKNIINENNVLNAAYLPLIVSWLCKQYLYRYIVSVDTDVENYRRFVFV
jgi:hypothetical protein